MYTCTVVVVVLLFVFMIFINIVKHIGQCKLYLIVL